MDDAGGVRIANLLPRVRAPTRMLPQHCFWFEQSSSEPRNHFTCASRPQL